MHVHFHSRYLIPETFQQLIVLWKKNPVLMTMLLVGLFWTVVEILRRTFGRITGGLIVFALVIYLILTLFGGSIYTLTHMKGFHFGG